MNNGVGKARNYDDEGFVKRAACICVNHDETQVLLVSSRRDSGLWIVPGGGLEVNEPPQAAALREVREEAGVSGRLGRCLGVFENPERGHRTSVYVLAVKEELEEWQESQVFGRKRKWFSVAEAVEELARHKPLQSSYLTHLLPPLTTTTATTTTTTASASTIYLPTTSATTVTTTPTTASASTTYLPTTTSYPLPPTLDNTTGMTTTTTTTTTTTSCYHDHYHLEPTTTTTTTTNISNSSSSSSSSSNHIHSINLSSISPTTTTTTTHHRNQRQGSPPSLAPTPYPASHPAATATTAPQDTVLISRPLQAPSSQAEKNIVEEEDEKIIGENNDQIFTDDNTELVEMIEKEGDELTPPSDPTPLGNGWGPHGADAT